MNAAKFWDGIADKYAKSKIDDMEAYTYTLDRTRSYLGANDAVLELGCGTGSTALLLAPGVRRYVATDVAPKMIEIGRQNAVEQNCTNVEFAATYADATECGDEEFDAVLAFNLLHLIPDPEKAVAHVYDVLKPGGVFISKTICKPESGFPFKYYAMMMAIPVMRLIGKAPFVRISTIAELESLIQARGFKLLETGNHPASPPRRYIVAQKTG